MLLVSRVGARQVARELFKPALVQRPADWNADADHGDGDLGGGPNDQAYCFLWWGVSTRHKHTHTDGNGVCSVVLV